VKGSDWKKPSSGGPWRPGCWPAWAGRFCAGEVELRSGDSTASSAVSGTGESNCSTDQWLEHRIRAEELKRTRNITGTSALTEAGITVFIFRT
jgi:hypothetical protein